MTTELNRFARIARRLVGAPSAVLCVLDGAAVGSEGPVRGAAGVSDRTADRFAQEVATAGRAAVAADRIGVPLVSACGKHLGSLCVFGARFPYYDENDIQALADLAVSAVRELEGRNEFLRATGTPTTVGISPAQPKGGPK